MRLDRSDVVRALTPAVIEEITYSLNHGNTVELKVEKGSLVVIDIRRSAKIKQSIESAVQK